MSLYHHNRFRRMPKAIRAAKPAANEPGTILQQFRAALTYLNDPLRELDPPAAWKRARGETIPHAQGDES